MKISEANPPCMSPLDGIRVLDLTRALAGPFCTMALADLGAEVIKVEPAPDGDVIRTWGPFDRGTSAYYLSTNRNKRGIALNFRSAQGLELLGQMVGRCDVLVENFKPGTMENMGLGADRLHLEHPRLIYANITGFGRSGPAGSWPGFDQIAQGYSGLMSLTGNPETGPVRVGVAIGDLTSGMWAAMGILGALLQRHQTGVGQRVETSLLASLVALLSVQGQRYLSLGEVPGPTGNVHPVIAPYGVFEAQDGPLNIAAATPGMWVSLCRLLHCEELINDARFKENSDRFQNRLELKSIIETRLRTNTRQHWTVQLLAVGIPAGPINTLADVFEDEQVKHCGLIQEIVHPDLGPIRQVGSPISFGMGERTAGTAPPRLGEHTRQVLMEFGYTSEAIGALIRDGVVLQHGETA